MREILLEGTAKEIKEIASKGLLTWKNQKVILDPFLELDFIIEVKEEAPCSFMLSPKVILGQREEGLEKWDLLTPLGGLQKGTFRFWKERNCYNAFCKIKGLTFPLTSHQLQSLMDHMLPLRWEKEINLKPSPLPLLKLSDKTGAFANLFLDYGPWGQKLFDPVSGSKEEKYWESDLLETGFQRKQIAQTAYFCPLDRVGKSLAFLLEIGWTILDYREKKVVLQSTIELDTVEIQDRFLVKGKVCFKEYEASLENVLGVFEKHERWIDLSSDCVGLLDLPQTWQEIDYEREVGQGITVRKIDVGVLKEIAPLPVHYQKSEWKDVVLSPAFKGALFPYQKQGVNWLTFLYETGFSALLADEMGLGKTVQILAFLSTLQGPCLIVMPVSLISSWKQQIEMFLPSFSYYIHHGINRLQTVESLKKQNCILTSYATLRSDILLFDQLTFDTVILDEAQTIKNSTTQIASLLYRIRSRFKIALSGTPIENKREEILSIFHFLLPQLFDSALASEKVIKKMRPFILRRTKEDVGLELPEKILQTIAIDPSDEEFALYSELIKTKKTPLMKKIEAEGIAAHRMEILELILRLRQQACHPKIIDPHYTGPCRKFSQVLNDLEEVVAAKQKVILYSQFVSILKLFKEEIESRGWGFVYLDGSTKDRENCIQQFQNNADISVFLISLKAGGIGLNLQAADYVFLYDPWWNSAVEQQAIDRAHRVGRKGRVIARKYFTTNSIEAKILDLQLKKEEVAQQIWEGQEAMDHIGLGQMLSLLDHLE